MKSSINSGGWNSLVWIMAIIAGLVVMVYYASSPKATKISAVPLESVVYASPTDQEFFIDRERVKVFHTQASFLQSEVENWFVEMEKVGVKIQVTDRLQSSYENKWVTVTVWYRHVVHNK